METISKVPEVEKSNKRIILQSSVLTPNPIILLQNQIKNLGSIEEIPADDLHLTHFHFGKPSELYDEIKTINSEIDYSQFLDEFYNHLLVNTTIDIDKFEVKGEGLSLFEKELKPIIALNLTENREMLNYRNKFLVKFEYFLKSFGIGDVDSFLNSSSNLRYQSMQNYIPHISIGYPTLSMAMTEIDTSDIKLELGTPHFKNIEFLK